jgi:hypothetical protein
MARQAKPGAVAEIEENSSLTYSETGNTEGDEVQRALLELHAERASMGSKASIPLPNRGRISVDPNVGMGYNGMDVTVMLGRPESILLNPRPGYKYVWKKRTDKQTAAYVRSGILRPVEVSEVDTTNPLAEYVEDVSPTGNFVTWDVLALFEMPPKWVKKIYTSTEEWAVARLAQQSVKFNEDVKARTGGAFEGDLSVTVGGGKS